jgi:predicted branched-subunit amino acid permease
VADHSFDRAAYLTGVRAALPLAVPPAPFALAVGIVIRESESVSTLAGWASSWLVFAGSAQLAALELLDDDASIAVVVLTIAMINARHIVYSAAFSLRLGPVPRWFRIVGSYVLIDQAFAVDEMQPAALPTRARMWTFLGAASVFWVVWNVFIVVGMTAGGFLPDDFPMNFIVALLFASLMVLAIRNRPGVAAAIVGGFVAIVARDLPSGMSVVLAILLGAFVGAALETLGNRRATG